MRNLVLSAALAAILSACAALHTPVVNVASPFNETQAKNMLNGTGKITGSGFLRQVGGGVVNCAGSTVRLIPATDYATERFVAIYGNMDGVKTRAKAIKFNPEPKEYLENMKTALCDAQGNFEFTDVGEGTFYLMTKVTWEIPVGYSITSEQGGAVATKVTLKQGEHKKVVLGR